LGVLQDENISGNLKCITFRIALISRFSRQAGAHLHERAVHMAKYSSNARFVLLAVGFRSGSISGPSAPPVLASRAMSRQTCASPNLHLFEESRMRGRDANMKRRPSLLWVGHGRKVSLRANPVGLTSYSRHRLRPQEFLCRARSDIRKRQAYGRAAKSGVSRCNIVRANYSITSSARSRMDVGIIH
jgi:hypothetical protein